MSRSSPSSSTGLGARRRSPNARQVPRFLHPLERRWLPLRGTAETTQEVTQACLHLGRSHSSRRQGWGPRVKLSPKPGLLVPMPWALTPRGEGPPARVCQGAGGRRLPSSKGRCVHRAARRTCSGQTDRQERKKQGRAGPEVPSSAWLPPSPLPAPQGSRRTGAALGSGFAACAFSRSQQFSPISPVRSRHPFL